MQSTSVPNYFMVTIKKTKTKTFSLFTFIKKRMEQSFIGRYLVIHVQKEVKVTVLLCNECNCEEIW